MIVAEVNRINYAWIKTYEGVILTNNGNVYKYDVAKNKDAYKLTKEDRLASSTKIGRLNSETYDRIITLSKKFYGHNAEMEHTGCDEGSFGITIYDGKGEWTISQTGDYSGSVDGTDELVSLLTEVYNNKNNVDYFIVSTNDDDFSTMKSSNGNSYMGIKCIVTASIITFGLVFLCKLLK